MWFSFALVTIMSGLFKLGTEEVTYRVSYLRLGKDSHRLRACVQLGPSWAFFVHQDPHTLARVATNRALLNARVDSFTCNLGSTTSSDLRLPTIIFNQSTKLTYKTPNEVPQSLQLYNASETMRVVMSKHVWCIKSGQWGRPIIISSWILWKWF